MGLFVGLLVGVTIGALGVCVISFMRRRRELLASTRKSLIDFVQRTPTPALLVDAHGDLLAQSETATELGIDESRAREDVAVVADTALVNNDVEQVVSSLGIPEHPDDAFSICAVPVAGVFVVVLITDGRESKRLANVRTDFLLNVSHEIKTPVAAIGLLSEALAAAAEDPDAVRGFAASLGQEVARLARMTRDVIELGRIEAGAVDTHRDRFCLTDAVGDAVEENANAAANKRITVSVESDPDAMVTADRRMITTALSNLVENAIQYSRGGTHVDVRVSHGNGRARVAVTDQGVGIRPENVDRVFERFYREDPSRSREGSGLGLSIVKHTASIHQGAVSVESHLGIGSTFHFEIPSRTDKVRTEESARG